MKCPFSNSDCLDKAFNYLRQPIDEFFNVGQTIEYQDVSSHSKVIILPHETMLVLVIGWEDDEENSECEFHEMWVRENSSKRERGLKREEYLELFWKIITNSVSLYYRIYMVEGFIEN